MTGRIDRMEVDPTARTISVVDYKTGKSYDSWKSDTKLHKYQLQLYAYKLLIEGSKAYHGYQVPTGRLEFIESSGDDRIRSLKLTFKPEMLERTKRLVEIVWQHITQLNFPDTSSYPATLAGIKLFEQDLIDRVV